MATPSQFAIREVALATFYSLETGKALFHLNNLKTSGLENSAETVYARGGRGNAKIVGFSGTREATVNLEDAVFTVESLAMMTGNGINTGVQNVYQRDVLKVNANQAELTKTPVGELISVYKLNPDGSHGAELTTASGTLGTGQYKLTAPKQVDFFAGDFSDHSLVVVYYKIATDNSAKKITVSSDKFAGSFRLVLDCLVRDTFTQKDYAAQIEIHAAKMEDNWSFSMAAEGDPSAFTMPISVLKPTVGTDMWTMTVYDMDAAS